MGFDIFKIAAVLEKNKSLNKICEEAQGFHSVSRVKGDLKVGVELLQEYLLKNKHHSAVSITLAMIMADADAAIARIRRSGCLRISKYGYRSQAVIKVVDAIHSMNLPPDRVKAHRLTYLLAVKKFALLSRDAEKIYSSLLTRLRTRKRYVQKSLLAFVNLVFSREWEHDPDVHSSDIRRWSREDIAQAYSFILNLIREEVGSAPSDWLHVDDSMVEDLNGSYLGMLADAATLHELREVESKIELMPYDVELSDKVLDVFSVDCEFDKSIQLGFIQTSKQMFIRAQGLVSYFKKMPEHSSIEELVSDKFEASFKEFVLVLKEPVERICVALPEIAVPLLIGDYLFPDEMLELLGLNIDNFQTSEEDPRNLLIGRTLTAGDAIYIQRYFRFLKSMYEEYLKSVDGKMRQRLLRIRSTILRFDADKLVQQLTMFLGAEKAGEALELLTLGEDQKFIDVQYRPLINCGDGYIVAPALLGHSNLARNMSIANGLRQKITGSKSDPMQEAVVGALVTAGFKVKSSYEYNMDGRRETDIICWKDNNLFVFECKNSYLPTSAHEISNTYEHLKKAEEQLDVRKKWLAVPGNAQKLMRSLEWDVTIGSIHTAVITANRLFTGYRLGEHPCRQALEFINVLLQGKVGRGELKPIKFWEGSEFSVKDIITYLSGGGIARSQLDGLKSVVAQFDVGRYAVRQKVYFEVAEDGSF